MSGRWSIRYAIGLALATLLLAPLSQVNAQTTSSLFDSIAKRDNGLRGYIFVSSQMSDTSLIAYAADAKKSGMTMVLNGFVDKTPQGLLHTQQFVKAINESCCGERGGAHWEINPPLFDRYAVKTAPTFLIAKGDSNNPADFSKVSGDMSVANAIKLFYQRSSIPEVKAESARVYKRLAADSQ